ncbi:ABC transporter substrate-binding protein [Hydrogenophaga taeniospiralis]|uniref:ABC transporter substrate-binding protein n=1 Tax=Hydrogenophaga taeniospiralis TaxID=65656 RepID=UPI001CFA21FF|nr:extracellular solute-binding protein [Hydrogenophaga taeniospiralis]UCU94954.1 extracellular solute-binding protein [Hydrogenophaga taeniospiralis]
MQNVLLKALSRALVVLGLCGSVAHAQDRVKELAEYQGADRQVRLIEAAKKENGITVYHAYPALSNVMTAFTKKYGIKTRAWRAGSEAVLQRLITEARGNRFEVDIVQNNAPENEAAHREKLLQAVRSPLFADLIPQAVPAHGEWTGITLDVWIAAYNTSRVSEEELPKRYEDLQDPKWKGRLGIEANNHGWFGTLIAELGEERGREIFKNIVATNGISARKGHSLLTTMVASGEVPLALTVYNWNPEQMKSKGAPIKGLALKPVIAQPSTVALLKNAPNPASAILFYDFIISEEGQRILQDFSYVTTHKRLPHPLRDASLKYIDPAKAIDMQTAWLSNFDEMIVKKAK